MNESQLPNYEIRQGKLADTYELFIPSTINTSSQISVDRIADESLRNKWFYTANVGFAAKRAGKLLLGIGGNSAFRAVFGTDTSKVCQELIDTGYIHLSPVQKDLIQMLEKSGEVIFVEHSALNLTGKDKEFKSFPIRTKNYTRDITLARMPFVSAGFGSGYMLELVMENLRTKGNIEETRVFTMAPDPASENVTDNEIVARACRLGYFVIDSRFIADGRSVDDSDFSLRGVLKNPAEGGAQTITLEKRLVGKGTDVGNGIIVVRRDQLSQEEYSLLTQKSN